MIALKQSSAIRRAHLPDLLAKKSRSTVNCPIFYIFLLLFTGMRRREAAGLRWANVDLVQKIIRLPAEATKAKRALALPMSTFVHELLVRRRAAGAAGRFVLPGPSKTGHITSADKPLHDVALATGIEVSCHDLRRTFASIAADTPEVSWLALKGHAQPHNKGRRHRRLRADID